MRTMAAGEFKAKCLGVLTEVQATGQTVIITRRGKPIARLAPLDEEGRKESPESIFGSLRDMVVVTGDIVSPEFTDEEWDRMFNEKWDRFDRGYSE
jgi:prevent-host-death family protein